MDEISTSLNIGNSVLENLTKKNRESTKIDFDSMDLSPDIENALSTLDPELIQEASRDEFDLSFYYREHLAKRYRGCKEMSYLEIMTFQKEMIGSSLLKLPSSLEDMSIQLFKNLLSYMGLRKSSKKHMSHIIKFIKISISAPEELKDEAFIQVIKQLSNNDNIQYVNKAWNFLAVLCSSYPPSVDLYKCLIHFFLKIIREDNDENIKKKANYCSIRLMRTFENKRKLAPSDEEIKYIEAMKPIMVQVHFFSGASTSIPIESYTTVRELKTSIMRKLQLKLSRIPYFAIYEICEKSDRYEQRYLDEGSNVADILSLWVREANFYSNYNINVEFKLYIKIQFYYPFKSEDLDTVQMHYMQTNFDVISGKYPLSESEIITLAVISLFVNHESKNIEDLKNILKTELKQYIPVNRFLFFSRDNWTKKILDKYSSIEFQNKNEAKIAYLELLKENIMFEAHQFPVLYSKKYNNETSNSQKIRNPEHIPEECIVAVKPKTIIITDLDRNEIIQIPLRILASWAVNAELIVLVVRKNERDFSKYYFESRQNKLFRIVMESYSNILSGKPMSDIAQMNEETCRMFESFPAIKLEEGETLRSIQSSIYIKNIY